MKIVGLLSRFFLTVPISVVIATLPNWIVWHEYWNKTIYKVQTVDLNIFFHTLPTKLSYNLIKKNYEELQRTLNSNYAFIGLIVTDCKTSEKLCSEQKITFTSEKYKDWKKLISSSDLKNHDYDLLYNPPPQNAQAKYEGHWETQRQLTNLPNQGEIIGRVYYIRGITPSFWQDYFQSFWGQVFTSPKDFFTGGKDVHQKYRITTFIVLVFSILSWIIIELFYQRRILKAENELLKISIFNSTFNHVIQTDFTNQINNDLQKLEHSLISLIARLNYDTKNIVHDLRKAPLLVNFKTIDNHIELIKDTEMSSILTDVNESIKTIDLVIEDLEELTDLRQQNVNLIEELKKLKDRLPPVITSVCKPKYIFQDEPIFINCNPCHLRSIIKNALYNSSKAMKKYKRSLTTEQRINYKPSIKIKCFIQEKYGCIEIEDNGPGIPSNIINQLYESLTRLNNEFGNHQGNGSIIVNAYLILNNGKVKKVNLEPKKGPDNIYYSGAKVTFMFNLVK